MNFFPSPNSICPAYPSVFSVLKPSDFALSRNQSKAIFIFFPKGAPSFFGSNLVNTDLILTISIKSLTIFSFSSYTISCVPGFFATAVLI